MRRLASSVSGPPKTEIEPRSGLNRSRIMRIVVVLPAPFGPSSPKISPPRSSNDTSSTARVLPNCLETCWTSTIGCIETPSAGNTSARGAGTRARHAMRAQRNCTTICAGGFTEKDAPDSHSKAEITEALRTAVAASTHGPKRKPARELVHSPVPYVILKVRRYANADGNYTVYSPPRGDIYNHSGHKGKVARPSPSACPEHGDLWGNTAWLSTSL